MLVLFDLSKSSLSASFLPANFSTTAIIFSMVILLCFVGGYPIKHLLGIVLSGILVLSIFILTISPFESEVLIQIRYRKITFTKSGRCLKKNKP